jgi:hypothetical protein
MDIYGRRLAFILASFSLLALRFASLGAEPAAIPPSLVFFGWDGAQREHVKDLMTAGKLPVLSALVRDGSWVDVDIDGATDTKAGWTELFTAYGPEITGVFDNGRYGPIPAGYTIFERYKARWGSAAAAAAIIAKKGHLGGYSPGTRIEITPRIEALAEEYGAALKKAASGKAKGSVTSKAASRASLRSLGKLPQGVAPYLSEIATLLKAKPGSKALDKAHAADAVGAGARIETAADGRRFFIQPGEPYLYTHTALDDWEIGLETNEAVGDRALAAIERYTGRPLLLFVHFAVVDHQGHRFGENSAQYEDALIDCDAWTGKILEALAKVGRLPGTPVFLSADHGFDEGLNSHKDAPSVFLASNLVGLEPDGRTVDRRDVAATMMDVLGLGPGAGEPALEGESLIPR